MRKLLFVSGFFVCALSIAHGQDNINLPDLTVNPEYPLTYNQPDSVLRFSYISLQDSLLLHKWEYSYNEIQNTHNATKYHWIVNLDKWSMPIDKYEYSFDDFGRRTLFAHYDWKYPNGFWRGCDSRGCGKKEWAYDQSGNQLLWTQSYWNLDSKDWLINDHWEKNYSFDSWGNMVMEATLNFKRDVWGTGYWEGVKDEYSYDIMGNQIGHVDYVWDNWGRNDWRPLTKDERSYNPAGNLESEAHYFWGEQWIGGSGQALSWTDRAKVEWIYDENGIITSGIQFRWNSTISWEPIADQILYEYNDDGLPIRELVFRFAGGGPGPAINQPVIKENIYDNMGKIIKESISSWEEQENLWIEDYWFEYKYDSTGNNIMYMGENFKREYSYDEMGNKTSEKYYYNGSYPKPYRLDTFKYDHNSRLLSEAYYRWNSRTNNWAGRERSGSYPSGKTEYQYDSLGNQILLAYYDWDNSIQEWVGCEPGKKEWKYNGNNDLIEEILFQWDTVSVNWAQYITYQTENNNQGDPIIQGQYSWNKEMEKWELVIRNFYYYHSSSTGKNSIPNPGVLIFPNPTPGIINITGLSEPAEVRVYNIQGQLMESFTQVDGVIDVSDLPEGVYFLNLTMGDKTIVRKMVVKR